MSEKRARWLAVLGPALAVAGVCLVDDWGHWRELGASPWPLLTLAHPVLMPVLAVLLARLAFARIDRLAEALQERNAILQRQNDVLQALRGVSHAIAAQASARKVLDEIAEKTLTLLGADVAALSLVGTEGTVRIAARRGPTEAFAGEDLEIVRPEFLASSRTAPLRRGATTIGLLTVGRRVERPAFGDDDGDLLASLAVEAEVAVENERLQRELRSLAIRGERERIARDMHDGLAQVLGYVNTKAQAVEQLLAVRQTDAARRQLAELSAAARSVYVDVREAILGLTSPVDAERDLAGALEEYVRRFADASKIAATVDVTPAARALRLAPAVQTEVFHIVQEALTNVRKHAAASRTALRVTLEDRTVSLTIEDDGVGFDPAAFPASDWPHYGIRSMRERAGVIGGRAQWFARPGAGTTFRLTVPAG